MKHHFFWILALLCLVSSPSYAQKEAKKKKDKVRHFVFGFGLQRFNIKDDAMSPVRYTGTSLAFNFGTQKQTAKWLSRVDFSLSGGTVKSIYYEDTERGSSFNLRLDIDYSRLQHIKQFPKGNIDWFLGGHLSALTGFRFHNQLDNSAGIYDSFNSLGISTAFQKAFEWKKRKFKFYYQLNVPLISMVMRPSFDQVFNFIDPESQFFKENFERHGWASFGSYLRLNNRFELSYTTRQILMGKHQLSLSTLFYF